MYVLPIASLILSNGSSPSRPAKTTFSSILRIPIWGHPFLSKNQKTSLAFMDSPIITSPQSRFSRTIQLLRRGKLISRLTSEVREVMRGGKTVKLVTIVTEGSLMRRKWDLAAIILTIKSSIASHRIVKSLVHRYQRYTTITHSL